MSLNRKILTFFSLALFAVATIAIAAEIKNDEFPIAVLHYKMTITVDTPEGLKAGSAVREVKMQFAPSVPGIPDPPMGYIGVKGEAVVVDLGKRGKVFGILRNSVGPDYGADILYMAFPRPGKQAGILTREGIRYYKTLKEGRKVLGPEEYPTMVMFADSSDPKSSKIVWIGEYFDKPRGRANIRTFRVKEDNFDKLFGAGVSLKEITIEITNEPITTGIRTQIPRFDNKPHIVGLDDFVSR